MVSLASCATASELDPGLGHDAGHDTSGGGADTGLVDSGPTDTSVEDSGSVDSGATDSTTVDTGTKDSGTTDTSVADAGTDAADSGADTRDVGTDVGTDTGVDAVVDAPVDATGCPTGPVSVLLYQFSWGARETPYLPAGATSTLATASTWKSMSTADFAKYNLIVIGEGGSLPSSGGDPTQWQPIFDTMSVWTPAVRGRVVVHTLDPTAAAHSTKPGASTFAKGALQWAATGPGTGLYVGPDLGNRKLDFLGGFGTWTALGQDPPDSAFGDLVTVVVSTGALAGSTSASLSNWASSYHGVITGFPAGFVAAAQATGSTTRSIVVTRDAACP